MLFLLYIMLCNMLFLNKTKIFADAEGISKNGHMLLTGQRNVPLIVTQLSLCGPKVVSKLSKLSTNVVSK